MPAHPLIEVHEDRISRLEGNLSDCRVDIGVLQEQVAAGVQLLSSKMDAVVSTHDNLDQRVSEIEAQHRIEKEVKQRSHDRRVRLFKIGASVGSVLGVIIGIVMKIVWGE